MLALKPSIWPFTFMQKFFRKSKIICSCDVLLFGIVKKTIAAISHHLKYNEIKILYPRKKKPHDPYPWCARFVLLLYQCSSIFLLLETPFAHYIGVSVGVIAFQDVYKRIQGFNNVLPVFIFGFNQACHIAISCNGKV